MSGVVVRKKVTTLDKIRKYYLKGPDAVTLTPKQEEIRIQVYRAWNLLCNYHSKEQAVNTLTNDQTIKCSRAQAYRYVNDALALFGDVLKNHKEAKRYLLEEDLIRLQQRAIKTGDGDLELRVIAQRIKISGVTKDDDAGFDPAKLAAQTYILKLDPAVVDMINSRANGNSFDFNMQDTEDVPFKDVTNEEEDGEE